MALAEHLTTTTAEERATRAFSWDRVRVRVR
jgi:hypothetical protein